ncbi:MAG: sarcosine oxidase subunit delta [Actinomycetota bacterium]|nr:sarcosine oxidase subunit delta [Actinomycetota bacterium]
MILISCPHCGPRNASEFRYAGEASARPDPNATTPEEWRAYLYTKSNPAGWTTEKWVHGTGCRRYFTVERHTITNEVRETRLPTARLEGSS